MEEKKYYVDLILPFPLGDFFTYHLSEKEFNLIKIGTRLIVPFRGNKLYSAIVYKKHHEEPQLYKTRPIYQILDSLPLITSKQLELWKWLSTYYFSSIGLISKEVIPKKLKLESQTYFSPTPLFKQINKRSLLEEEFLFFEALEKKGTISINEIIKLTNKKAYFPLIKKFLKEGWITPQEYLIESYQEKKENYLFLNKKLTESPSWKITFNSLSEKQKALLLGFITLHTSKKLITPKILLEKYSYSRALLDALIKKNILEIHSLKKNRILDYPSLDSSSMEDKIELTLNQQSSYKEIQGSFQKKDIVLFYAITASGKTFIYMRLIKDILAQKKKVLFLVPELSFAIALLEKCNVFFKEKIALYHPQYNENEKVELWKNILNNKYDIVIGTPHALFLPMENIGLIIIDQEEDTRFKESKKAPFYDFRHSALIWAKIHQAKTLLASSSPSLESYFHAKKGKYGFVLLDKRHESSPHHPIIHLIDLKKSHYKKQMKGLFSLELLKAIEETLKEKKQIILFQNKRGYASIIQCHNCGYAPKCPHCDISLAYHKEKAIILCHYCNYHHPYNSMCLICKGYHLDTKGIGVEQIEEQVKKIFPNASIARIDRDSMQKKFSYEELIYGFENKKIDILIGTQMINKGLDFSFVGLVGILEVDALMLRPHFKAYERAFQLLTQLAGRAGRRTYQGAVYIQSFQPSHLVLESLKNQDYKKIAYHLLKERKTFFYPPYCKLILISMKNKNLKKLIKASENMASLLKIYFKKNILGPQSPPVEKIRDLYIRDLLIKTDIDKESIHKTRSYLKEVLTRFQKVKAYENFPISINIDY